MELETVKLYGKSENGEFVVVVNLSDKKSYIEKGYYEKNKKKEDDDKTKRGRPRKTEDE